MESYKLTISFNNPYIKKTMATHKQGTCGRTCLSMTLYPLSFGALVLLSKIILHVCNFD